MAAEESLDALAARAEDLDLYEGRVRLWRCVESPDGARAWRRIRGDGGTHHRHPSRTERSTASSDARTAPDDPEVSRARTTPGTALAPLGTRRSCADPVGALGQVVETLETLTTTAWHDVSGQGAHDALDLVEQAGRRLAAVRGEVLNVVDGNGLWAVKGARTFSAWLRTRTGSTAGAASRQVRESRALRDHLPLTREALAAGTISPDHAGVLVREATRTKELREALTHEEVGEAFLVEHAKAMDAGTFTKLVRSWSAAADPQGADRAWREKGSKEELTLSQTTDGWHLNGWLDTVSGQLVSTALGAHAGRKGAGDERTPAQRRAAALVSLARQSLDIGLQGAGARVRPHLTVTSSLELLRTLAEAMGSPIPPRRPDGKPYAPGAAFGPPAEAALSAPGGPQDPGLSRDECCSSTGGLFELTPEARKWMETWQPGDEHVISTAIDYSKVRGIEPATLEDGSPVPVGLLGRLACESQLSRVIFGADSTILDVGREQRLFTASQARAIFARDKHCQYPDCDAPPGFGEIHHSIAWALGGRTDVEHGILLCWHHHDWVHAHRITITRAAGRWWFRDRHGWLITGTPRP